MKSPARTFLKFKVSMTDNPRPSAVDRPRPSWLSRRPSDNPASQSGGGPELKARSEAWWPMTSHTKMSPWATEKSSWADGANLHSCTTSSWPAKSCAAPD